MSDPDDAAEAARKAIQTAQRWSRRAARMAEQRAAEQAANTAVRSDSRTVCMAEQQAADRAADTAARSAAGIAIHRAASARQIGDSGQVRGERIAVGQIPKDQNNCGGLAEVVEVSPTVTHSCLPQQRSWEMAISAVVQIAVGVKVMLNVTCAHIMSPACLNCIKLCWVMTC